MPCGHCGQLLWFVRKPLGEVVILTFFPGWQSPSTSINHEHRSSRRVICLGSW